MTSNDVVGRIVPVGAAATDVQSTRADRSVGETVSSTALEEQRRRLSTSAVSMVWVRKRADLFRAKRFCATMRKGTFPRAAIPLGNVPLCIVAQKRFARKRSARYRTPLVSTRTTLTMNSLLVWGTGGQHHRPSGLRQFDAVVSIERNQFLH